MLPLAPGLLSTMTDALQRSPSFCPARRARMSGPVPRENGTTMLMILPGAGYEGCACAAAAGKSRATGSVKCQENFAVSTCSGAREESERPRLDALARRRARRRGRIDERAVRGEARAAVLGRFEYLEYQRLVAPHQRKIEPAVIRVVADAVRLAHAGRIAALGADQVPGGEAARVRDRERVGLDRLICRAPHLDDGEAALQEGVRFARQQIANPLRPGPLRIVVVHVEHGLAHELRLALGLVARAQGVIEDDDPRGAGNLLHQRLDLGIVDALQFIGVEEIADPRPVLDEFEACDLQIELVLQRPAVADRHRPLLGLARLAAANVPRAEGLVHRFHAAVDGVVEPGGHRAGFGSKGRCSAHDFMAWPSPASHFTSRGRIRVQVAPSSRVEYASKPMETITSPCVPA